MKKEIADQLIFRSMTEGDKGYIFSSWISSLSDSEILKKLHPSLYRPVQKSVIQKCLEHSKVVIVSLKEDDTSIVGYLIFDGDMLHWINIKHPYRKFGIAKYLIETYAPRLKFFSHQPSRYHVGKKDKMNLVYNPFYIWSAYYGVAQSNLHPSRRTVCGSGEGVY